MITTETLSLSTKGHTDILDITPQVERCVQSLSFKNGIVTIHVLGSTAAITTCEYEPGLVKDLKEIFQQLIPEGRRYHHDKAWHDGNGYAHLRASLIGPSLTLPFQNKTLMLGTWQQIILIDFDNRPRERKLVLQFVGE